MKGPSRVVRRHWHLGELRLRVEPGSHETIGEFIRAVRCVHGLSQPEFSAVLGWSAGSVSAYECGRRRPAAIFVLDLLDSFPYAGSFNDIAENFSYSPITSIDPDDYRSIHHYVAGVRVYLGYSRAVFAATLGGPPSSIRCFEHREKPQPEILERMVSRHLRPGAGLPNSPTVRICAWRVQ